MSIKANEASKIRTNALQKCMHCNLSYFFYFHYFSNIIFTLFTHWMFQTISHLKVLLHILVGGVLGAIFLDSGNNGSKTISNLGYLFCCVVYLSYTTMLPAVIRCEFYYFICWFVGIKLTNLHWWFVASMKILINSYMHLSKL
jgi:hypothetical protein